MKKLFTKIVMNFDVLKKKTSTIRKPRWFKWNFFPKEGVPPTQSILELLVFVIILFFCKSYFDDFNKIPHYNISIEADKLADNRFVKESNGYDSLFYLHYQIANLKLTIPMVSAEYKDSFETSAYYGSIRDDSMSLYCRKVCVSTPYSGDISNQLRLKSKISPYWHAVYDIAARRSGYHPVPSGMLTRDFYNVRESLRKCRTNNNIKAKLKTVKTVIPDSLSNIMQNYYYFKISSNILDEEIHKKMDANVEINSAHPLEYVFIDENGKSLYDIWNVSARSSGKETIMNKENEFIELYHANNYTKRMSNDYARLCAFNSRHISFTGDTVGAKFYCYKSVKTNNTKKRHLAIERPSWRDRHDISRGWYKIMFNTSTIDSVVLTIDFVGATDFYPMRIEPDEKGSSYIIFSDPEKILQIQREGLTFYAQFKDLENLQTIRCFFVTAIISGLLIVLLTSIIIGIYRGLKTIGESVWPPKNNI